MACLTDFEECVAAVASFTPQKPTSSFSAVDSNEIVSGSLSHVCNDPVMDDDDDDLIDLSKISSFRDDSSDKTYVCSEDDSDEDDIHEVNNRNYVNEPKYGLPLMTYLSASSAMNVNAL